MNVKLISCAQLCADLQCWIVLNGTGGCIYDKGGNKLCSLQTLGNLFILELGLQSKSRCLVTLFSKGNINTWHRRLWRSWWLPHLPSMKTQTLQVLKKDILRSTTSRASPLRCHGSFHRGILGIKILSPSHRRDVKKGFYQDTEIPIWGCGLHAGAH